MTTPRRKAIGAVLAAAVLLSGLSVAPAAVAASSKDRIAIGDSVMLGARTALKKRGFAVDAAVSRQAYVGPSLVRKKGAELPENVVVHLGTNGTFPLDTCRKLVKAAGKERRVFLVTVYVKRSWARSNNATMRTCAKAFPEGRVTVVDWNAEAKKHPSWFYGDGTHLKPAGGVAFARLLDRAVDTAAARSVQAAPAATESDAEPSLLGASGSATVGLTG